MCRLLSFPLRLQRLFQLASLKWTPNIEGNVNEPWATKKRELSRPACRLNIKFKMRSPLGSMTFIHSFIVCPLDICSAGILGLDFLQRVGAEISLTDNSLMIRTQQFPLSSASLQALASSDSEAPPNPVHGLITRDAGRALDVTDDWEDYESWAPFTLGSGSRVSVWLGSRVSRWLDRL
jgi:hypothetical protein